METDKSAYIVPWRRIAEPRSDVAQGKFQQAEFAADLSLVLQGNAVLEYQDSVEFYDRTYITEGMRGMLIKAVQRVSGKGGEPVIQLKTAFGGGKTHSMLSLYHLMGTANPEKLRDIPDIFREAEVAAIPKVTVAVLVGTFLDPTKPRQSDRFPEIWIHTLWGEMTAQLAEQSGNPGLYNLIKDADEKGISPGSATLQAILDACAPCMILIDELVAYTRKLYGVNLGDLPAGTFENVLSFVQELTEAARASKRSIIVASIPESDIETGGEAGKLALKRIEHTFGRMEAIWKPVVAEEGFEIVRRRLFKLITDKTALERTCRAFFSLYQENPALFPTGCRETDYLEKMQRCYPIHPEIFDCLYNDWATIDHFQRTRGVLRFLATLIYDLYSSNDSSAMITSGSIAVGKPQIRDELTRYLSDGWNPIIDREIDGRNAKPPKLDDSQGGYYKKQFAYNRIARTIFLGSAPASHAQKNRGLDSSRIHLGVIQPEENIPVYDAALTALADTLTYLYRAENRYWFDTRPTLKKTVADRAQLLNSDEIIFSLENKLKTLCRTKHAFEGVHIAPAHSGDIPDTQSLRLVLLSPGKTYQEGEQDSSALNTVKDYYENRGNAPRIYHNMISFLAPDRSVMDKLTQDMRMFMAWQSIQRDAESLNLDNAQQREVKDAILHLESTLQDGLQTAYAWLILPMQEGVNPVTWSVTRVPGTGDPVSKSLQKMREEELLIETLAPKILSMEMSQYLQWKERDHIQVRELWEYYTKYVYLHRLKNQEVLFKALEAGVLSGEYFAYAAGQDSSGTYTGVVLGSTGAITPEGLMVKPELVKPSSEKVQGTTSDPQVGTARNSSDPVSALKPMQSSAEQRTNPTHFFGAVDIDVQSMGKHTGAINLEVIQHLKDLPKAHLTLTLDIHAHIPGGISEELVRTIRENCRTLRFKSSEFE